jgi:hypothetical protein
MIKVVVSTLLSRNAVRCWVCVVAGVLLIDEGIEFYTRIRLDIPYDPQPWRPRTAEILVTEIDSLTGQCRYRMVGRRWRLLTLWGTPVATPNYSLTEIIDRHPEAQIELV